ARRLVGQERTFVGCDQSAKLKLLGLDVAMFGEPFQTREPTKQIVLHDLVNGIYKKLILSDDAQRLLGGVLVGDASDYQTLGSLTRGKKPLPMPAQELITGKPAAGPLMVLDDAAQVCSCNNVTRGELCSKISDGACTVADLKSATRAGTGCGGCVPL